jgi:hypothetical protein
MIARSLRAGWREEEGADEPAQTKALDGTRADIHLGRDNSHVPYGGWGDNVPRYVVNAPMTAKNRIMICRPAKRAC